MKLHLLYLLALIRSALHKQYWDVSSGQCLNIIREQNPSFGMKCRYLAGWGRVEEVWKPRYCKEQTSLNVGSPGYGSSMVLKVINEICLPKIQYVFCWHCVDVHKPTSSVSFLRFIPHCHIKWLFWYGSERYCTHPAYLGMKARGEEQNKDNFPACGLLQPCCISALCVIPLQTLPLLFHYLHLCHSFTITTVTTRKEMWSAVEFEELKLKKEKRGGQKKKRLMAQLSCF